MEQSLQVGVVVGGGLWNNTRSRTRCCNGIEVWEYRSSTSNIQGFVLFCEACDLI